MKRRRTSRSAAAPAPANDDLRRFLQQYDDAFNFSYCAEGLSYIKKGRVKDAVLAWTQLAVYVFKRKKRTLKFRIPFALVQQLTLPNGNEDAFAIHWEEQALTIVAPDRKTLVVNYQQLKNALHAFKGRDAARQIDKKAAGKAREPADHTAANAGDGPAVGDRDVKNEDPEARAHPILLACLVDSDFVDYGALRSVYDRLQADEMRQHLRDYVDEQRQLLTRLCATRMDAVLGVLAQVSDISSEAPDVADAFQAPAAAIAAQVHSTAEGLHAAASRCEALRRVSHNVQQAAAMARVCAEVARLDAQATAFLAERRYYPALVTLERLQETAAGLSDCDYVRYLRTHRIPAIRTTITTAVKRSFNEWLTRTRALCDGIGARALEQARDVLDKRARALRRQVLPRTAALSAGRADSDDSEADEPETPAALAPGEEEEAEQEAALQSATSSTRAAWGDVEAILGQSRSLPMAPSDPSAGNVSDGLSLYCCQRIYERLHREDELQLYYMTQRQKQLDQELGTLRRLPAAEWPQQAPRWYGRCAGFFIVEDIVRRATTPPLSSGLHLCTLWEQTAAALVAHLAIPDLDPDPAAGGVASLVAVTQVTVQFVTAVGEGCSCDLDTAPLVRALESRHGQVLATSFARAEGEIRSALTHESYEPLPLDGSAVPLPQLEALRLLPRPHSPPKAPVPVPHANGLNGGVGLANGSGRPSLPPPPLATFTATVPRVLTAVSGHMDLRLTLAQHLPSEGLQEAVDRLLIGAVQGVQAKAARLGKTHIAPLAQLYANLRAWLDALPGLEAAFAARALRRVRDPALLQPTRAALAVALAALEDQIARVFRDRVADTTAVLTPCLWSVETKRDSAHNHFEDVVQYLSLSLAGLTPLLPSALLHRLRVQGFAHIAEDCGRLAEALLAPAHPVTDAGRFKQDLRLFLEFVDGEGADCRRAFDPVVRRLGSVSDDLDPVEPKPVVPFAYVPEKKRKKWTAVFKRSPPKKTPN